MLPDKKLHASGEDYLEAVLVLQKKKGMVRSVDVARYMEVSKPSVCHAVATLKAGGFLTMDEDFFLRLTDIGREVAEQTYEKHCFFTRLLVEAGVEPKTAEQEACCIQHRHWIQKADFCFGIPQLSESERGNRFRPLWCGCRPREYQCWSGGCDNVQNTLARFASPPSQSE